MIVTHMIAPVVNAAAVDQRIVSSGFVGCQNGFVRTVHRVVARPAQNGPVTHRTRILTVAPDHGSIQKLPLALREELPGHNLFPKNTCISSRWMGAAISAGRFGPSLRQILLASILCRKMPDRKFNLTVWELAPLFDSWFEPASGCLIDNFAGSAASRVKGQRE
jgi:hypothetical protein